jgi:sugar-phosphatase
VKAIVSADDVRECKPHPAGYLEALKIAGCEPREAIVIEDSASGIRAGKLAGCEVWGVAHSYGVETLQTAGADLVFEAIGAIDLDAIAGAR